jgi:hypothetical protein
MKQHPLAQPEGPGGELFVGLPALGEAGHDVAALVDVGQAVIHRSRGLVVLILVLNMWVEASHIDAWAIVQGAAALRMALARGRPISETESSHAGKRCTSGDQEVTPGMPGLSIGCSSGHTCPPSNESAPLSAHSDQIPTD